MWGQCTESLQEVIRGLENCKYKDFDFNVKWLLERIQQMLTGIDKIMVNISELVFVAARKFHTIKQYETS